MFDAKRGLVENPIHRYAIGSRTEGLHYNPDGSLDVFIQAVATPGKTSNWLPCPRGPSLLTMRLYLPKLEVLNGEDKIPPVLCTDCFNAGSAAPAQGSPQQRPRAERFSPPLASMPILRSAVRSRSLQRSIVLVFPGLGVVGTKRRAIVLMLVHILCHLTRDGKTTWMHRPK